MVRCEARRWFTVAVCLSFLLLLCACDPPGKPKPEPSREQVVDFKRLYGENCAGCHGENGRNGAGRILNDPLYLAVLPKDVMHGIIEKGRPGTSMPAWAKSEGGPLEPRQIDTLVNDIYANWAKPVDLGGGTLPPYSADIQSGDAGRGQKLFAMNCFMCHGRPEIGSVTEPTYLSLVTNQMLRTAIIVGRPDFGMPNFRNLKLGHALSDQDISDLVAFLASKRPANVFITGNEGSNGSQRGVN